MEEKLYFKPGNYGKGRKKKQTEQKVDNAPEKKDHKAIKLISLLLFLLIVVIIIIWLLHGKTTTHGQYPENLKNESLTCISNELIYPATPATVSEDRELKINAIFNGENHLSSINLSYSLSYQTTDDVVKAEALAHADFNRKLGKRGFSAGKFNNKFTVLNDRLVVSIYGNTSDITQETSDFFMIDSNTELPKTIWEYKKAFEATGFKCTSTLD